MGWKGVMLEHTRVYELVPRQLASSDEAIVVGVGSDPEPKHAVLHFDGERTVVDTDA